MALIKCYECEKEISDKAPACPHCGAPAEEIPHEVSVNGVIVEKGHTKKGKKEGLWEFSYRDDYVAGALSSKGLYNKDEKCGQWGRQRCWDLIAGLSGRWSWRTDFAGLGRWRFESTHAGDGLT